MTLSCMDCDDLMDMVVCIQRTECPFQMNLRVCSLPFCIMQDGKNLGGRRYDL